MTKRAASIVFVLIPLLALLVLVAHPFGDGPAQEALVGTIIVVNAVLGAFLVKDRKPAETKKPDGILDVVVDHEAEETSLNFSMSPERLFEGAEEVVLQVKYH